MKLPLIFCFVYSKDEEDKISLREVWQFYYPEDLETSDAETETGIRESDEAMNDYISNN